MAGIHTSALTFSQAQLGFVCVCVCVCVCACVSDMTLLINQQCYLFERNGEMNENRWEATEEN